MKRLYRTWIPWRHWGFWLPYAWWYTGKQLTKAPTRRLPSRERGK